MDSLMRFARRFTGKLQHRFSLPLAAELARIAMKHGSKMEAEDDDDEDEDRGSSSGRRSTNELTAQLLRLIEKRGGGESGAQAVALKLLDDNEKARDGRRKWKERAEAAEGKIPKEGQVVLSKEDAASFELYKVLGKPDEVKKKVEEGATAATTLKDRDTAETIANAASLAQIPNGKLLAKLAGPTRENFIIELRDEVREGKAVKAPFARKNEANSAFMPLADFAKKELAEYMPALLAKGEGTNGSSSQQQTTFTATPEQTTTGTAPTAGGVVDTFISTRNKAAAARPNPLAPPAPAPVAAVTKT